MFCAIEKKKAFVLLIWIRLVLANILKSILLNIYVNLIDYLL